MAITIEIEAQDPDHMGELVIKADGMDDGPNNLQICTPLGRVRFSVHCVRAGDYAVFMDDELEGERTTRTDSYQASEHDKRNTGDDRAKRTTISTIVAPTKENSDVQNTRQKKSAAALTAGKLNAKISPGKKRARPSADAQIQGRI